MLHECEFRLSFIQCSVFAALLLPLTLFTFNLFTFQYGPCKQFYCSSLLGNFYLLFPILFGHRNLRNMLFVSLRMNYHVISYRSTCSSHRLESSFYVVELILWFYKIELIGDISKTSNTHQLLVFLYRTAHDFLAKKLLL